LILNDAAFSVNGQAVLTDSAVTLPTVTQMTIGTAQASAYANGPIARIVCWPQRLPNHILQALTR
jgi:hypothetical protein